MELKNKVIVGDCLDVLKEIPDNYFDSVITDPPYGLSQEPDINEVLAKWLNGEDYKHRGGGFMGKTWDSFVPGPSVWKEVYRVLKPGGHLLCFAGTRTEDLMSIAIRMAGFERRDEIEWLYMSGFPKALDVRKQFDKRKGFSMGGKAIIDITIPATELAKKWDGWKTALKPAHEPILMFRKPLEKNVCYNVEKWGTGALNIDGCRIPMDEEDRKIVDNRSGSDDGKRDGIYHDGVGKRPKGEKFKSHENGRFPANCITLEDDQFYSKYFNITPKELSKKASKKDRNSDWQGNEIDLLERKAGGLQGRNDGSLGKVTYNKNHHPTVKPVPLMEWLIKLVTQPGGIVLDPFCGSGSTLVAAKKNGFNYVGIDLNEEYAEIAKKRLGE